MLSDSSGTNPMYPLMDFKPAFCSGALKEKPLRCVIMVKPTRFRNGKYYELEFLIRMLGQKIDGLTVLESDLLPFEEDKEINECPIYEICRKAKRREPLMTN